MNTTPTRATGAERLTIGVSDLQVSADPEAVLVTHALGSCIGVTVYDPDARVGGMLHFMLPSGRQNPEKAKANPAMFGDSGIPLLFRRCYELGAKKERIVVCAAGGAEVMNDNGQFKIGSRNRTVLRQLFWKNNILLAAEETGGNISRTMQLELDSGRVTIRNKGQEHLLWSA
jgi:chemotaxis protein CheD